MASMLRARQAIEEQLGNPAPTRMFGWPQVDPIALRALLDDHGRLQGIVEADEQVVTLIDRKQVNYPWRERYLGLTLTHTELLIDGIDIDAAAKRRRRRVARIERVRTGISRRQQRRRQRDMTASTAEHMWAPAVAFDPDHDGE